MVHQRFATAAAAALCLSLAVTPALAAKHRVHHYRSNSYAQYAAYSQNQFLANSLSGTYASDAFYPSPLQLQITGMDPNGNLSGMISGWRSSYTGGEVGDRWERWQHVFGADGTRAYYRDGQITIVFPNNATYLLTPQGSTLQGQFIADNDRQSIIFNKQVVGYGSSMPGR